MDAMLVVSSIIHAREWTVSQKGSGNRVGLVPTMGALHDGHLSLVEAARKHCDQVALTIFVNPTQFAPHEDLSAYPRPLEKDLALCRDAGVNLVFTPTVAEMYPDEAVTTVHVAKLTDGLCGPFRPGHFDGVATVVAKLFNILPANAAFFGEKDYQQLQVIRRMVADLNLPISIIGCPTIREPDGLAMSSRNVYLSPEQRKQASSIHRALSEAVACVQRGEKETAGIIDNIRQTIMNAGPATIEYISVVDAENLAPLSCFDRPARLCVAVRIGKCRLIDNVPVDALS
jgi:pantoate--beta-alanine ligase